MGRPVARHQTIRRAVLTAALIAIAACATAQPLADAARRAEVQRKTSAVEPLVLEQPSRPDGPLKLTHELVGEYVEARLALADVRRADRQLDFRMSKTMRARFIRSYSDFLPVLEGEDAVIETLAGFGFTPASYLFVEAALVRGRAAASRPKPFLVAGAHAENVRFVLAHLAAAEAALNRGFQAEQKLHSCCPVLSAD